MVEQDTPGARGGSAAVSPAGGPDSGRPGLDQRRSEALLDRVALLLPPRRRVRK